MEVIILGIGIIIGLLINLTEKRIKEGEVIVPNIFKEKAQFIEAISPREKWDNSKNIGDLLE